MVGSAVQAAIVQRLQGTAGRCSLHIVFKEIALFDRCTYFGNYARIQIILTFVDYNYHIALLYTRELDPKIIVSNVCLGDEPADSFCYEFAQIFLLVI